MEPVTRFTPTPSTRRWSLLVVTLLSAISGCIVADDQSAFQPTLDRPDVAPPTSVLAPLYSAQEGRGQDRYIVKLNDAEVPKDLTATVAADILGIAVAEDRRIWPEFRGFYARIPKDNVAKVRRHPLVSYVEADGQMYPDRAPVLLGPVPRSGVQSSPPWHLDRIDESGYPLDRRYAYNRTGRGVRIYVIDSGIRSSHTDFGRRASTAYQAELRWTPRYTDCNGHGTQVASAAAGNHWGVAKEAIVIGVRVYGCRSRPVWKSNVIDGMEWVTTNRILPAVVVMSLKSTDNLIHSISDAAEDLIQAGVVVVKSAGNDSRSACTTRMHRVSSVIVVGALELGADRRFYQSNFGSCVDLYAPGTSMWTAGITSDTDSAAFGGTSGAAPQAAGAAAMYLERYPNDSPIMVHEVIKWGATPTNVVGEASADRVLYINQPAMHGVSVAGPSRVGASETCIWKADAVGGRQPFTFRWSGVLSGTGATVAGRVRSSGHLTVRVVDSTGQARTHRKWVTVGSPAGCPN